MVKVKDLYFSYKKDNIVIDNISLTINKGEFVCILGHNGSGGTSRAGDRDAARQHTSLLAASAETRTGPPVRVASLGRCRAARGTAHQGTARGRTRFRVLFPRRARHR